MPVKKWTKDDGTEVTERYELWYETAWEQLVIGGVACFMGVAILVSLPFCAVYCMFRPKVLEYKESGTSIHTVGDPLFPRTRLTNGLEGGIGSPNAGGGSGAHE